MLSWPGSLKLISMLVAVKPNVFRIGDARFGLYQGDAPLRKRSALTGSITILTSVLLATLLFPSGWLAGPAASVVQAATRSGSLAIAQRRVTAGDLQALFFVWASGTPAVQRAAAQDCASLALSA